MSPRELHAILPPFAYLVIRKLLRFEECLQHCLPVLIESGQLSIACSRQARRCVLMTNSWPMTRLPGASL